MARTVVTCCKPISIPFLVDLELKFAVSGSFFGTPDESEGEEWIDEQFPSRGFFKTRNNNSRSDRN